MSAVSFAGEGRRRRRKATKELTLSKIPTSERTVAGGSVVVATLLQFLPLYFTALSLFTAVKAPFPIHFGGKITRINGLTITRGPPSPANHI